MTYSNRLIWVDSIDRVGNGAKRHIYEKDGTVYARLCGIADNRGHAAASTSELVRVEDTEFAVNVNACEKCVEVSGLGPYREENMNAGSGADNVDYDPFGVFDK
jgi:hypothetical protein